MKKKNLVVFTGAGISAESGLDTFRGSNGLWNGYNVYDVATPEAWYKDPQLVLDFYDMRRREVAKVQSNLAHQGIAALEDYYNVVVITQNVDDLHERAGSSNVIHLHGEITKVCDSIDKTEVQHWGYDDLPIGSTCKRNSQLRPYIVWFGEAVPMMESAIEEVMKSDIFVVIGTSLQVYPAANLCHFITDDKSFYYINPDPIPSVFGAENKVVQINKKATEGVGVLREILIP